MNAPLILPRRRHGIIKPLGRPLGVIKPLAPRGLKYCWPFADPSFKELLHELKVDHQSGGGWGSCQYGQGWKNTSTSGTIGYTLPNWLSSTQPFSIEALVYFTSALTALSTDVFGVNNSTSPGSSQAFLLSRSPTGSAPALYLNSSAASVSGTTATAANTLMHVVGTWDGATITIYENGVSEGTASASGNTSSAACALFGNVYSGISAGLGVYLLGNIAEVCWTDAEVMQRYLAPYDFIEWQEDYEPLVGVTSGGAAGFLPFNPWPQAAPILAQ